MESKKIQKKNFRDREIMVWPEKNQLKKGRCLKYPKKLTAFKKDPRKEPRDHMMVIRKRNADSPDKIIGQRNKLGSDKTAKLKT